MRDTPIDSNRFPYLVEDRRTRYMARLVLSVMLTVGMPFIILQIVLLALGLSEPSLRVPGRVILIVLLTAVFVNLLPAICAGLVITADLEATESGVVQHLLGYWKVHIPFQNLQGATVEEAQTKKELGLPRSGNTVFLLHIPNLTILHRIASLIYPSKAGPSVIITQDHHRHEQLIELFLQSGAQMVESGGAQ